MIRALPCIAWNWRDTWNYANSPFTNKPKKQCSSLPVPLSQLSEPTSFETWFVFIFLKNRNYLQLSAVKALYFNNAVLTGIVTETKHFEIEPFVNISFLVLKGVFTNHAVTLKGHVRFTTVTFKTLSDGRYRRFST